MHAFKVTVNQLAFGNLQEAALISLKESFKIMPGAIAPNPKSNSKPNHNANWGGGGGGNLSRGQLSGCPPTLKLTLTLTQAPTLTGFNFPWGEIVWIP